MGFLSRLSSVAAPARLRASSASDYTTAFFSGDDMPGSWATSLSAAGVNVTPDLALTLSAYLCGVKTIAYDLSTLQLRMFKTRRDGGKDLVQGGAFSTGGGIGHLAYRLGLQPNNQQSAAEYYAGQLAQFLLRGFAYAEIVEGPSGFLEQLLPRHPDRVTPLRLPNGAMTYKLIEANGRPRYLTEPEMHVVRDISTDNVHVLGSVQYGANAIGTALAAERAAAKFFKSGMTAATVATYKGEMDDEDEAALHKSISRYAAGVENSFGLMLIPDDVTVANLGVEPEKAQMMLAREWGVVEVARHLRISPRKLMARTKGDGYGSAYQDAIDHVVSCLRPIAVMFEQAQQRDLILAKDTYLTRFHLGELLRGDPAQMGAFIEQLIQNRIMTPSEVRMTFMDLNPDPALDKLSEGDNRPGQSGGGSGSSVPQPSTQNARASLKSMLAVHDNAVRCLRRERAAVEKLAKKYASDPEGWQRGLREFEVEHATFVAHTMRIPLTMARGVCAQHGSEFETQGVKMFQADGDAAIEWERYEADELAALALDDHPETVDNWFGRRLVDARASAHTHIGVSVPVAIDKGAVQVDARTTVEGVTVDARTAPAVVHAHVDARTTVAATRVDVKPAAVHIDKGAVHVDVKPPSLVIGAAAGGRSVKTVRRDPDTGLIDTIVETTAAAEATPIIVRTPARRTTKTIKRDAATHDITAIEEDPAE